MSTLWFYKLSAFGSHLDLFVICMALGMEVQHTYLETRLKCSVRIAKTEIHTANTMTAVLIQNAKTLM